MAAACIYSLYAVSYSNTALKLCHCCACCMALLLLACFAPPLLRTSFNLYMPMWRKRSMPVCPTWLPKSSMQRAPISGNSGDLCRYKFCYYLSGREGLLFRQKVLACLLPTFLTKLLSHFCLRRRRKEDNGTSISADNNVAAFSPPYAVYSPGGGTGGDYSLYKAACVLYL